MNIENDEAVKAANEHELEEIEEGYKLQGTPSQSITQQYAVDEIPKKPVTQEMLNETTTDQTSWLTYGGGYEQQRYSSANVITPDNVTNLELEYLVETGIADSMEGSPLIVPGDPPIMYQTNGPDHGKAINARTGKVLWSYTYANPDGLILCCDTNNRGFGILGDTLFMTTLDSGVVALDRYTGEQKWYTSTGKWQDGYSATWAPTPYNGMVITGSAGGEYGVRGFVTALDAKSGKQKWKTETRPKDQWVGDSWKQGSTTTWMSRTIDRHNDVIFSPVGNPGPDFDGAVRPGPNRFSVGTLALDANSGKPKWNYQESPHDTWDYDSSSPKVLIRDQKVDGKKKDIVVSPGKTGWVQTLDATNGKLLKRSEPTVQHLNTFKEVPHVGDQGISFVPGAQGGNDWQPPSYSPKTGLVYMKQQNTPQQIWWQHQEYSPGGGYFGGTFHDWPDVNEPDGWNGKTSAVVAVNPRTGKRVWREWIEDDSYLWGGSMTTAGGLTFLGTQKGNFVAYDGKSGDRLWQMQLGAPICSSPSSWYDPGTNKQYIAVQVGGSGWLRHGRRGSTVAVFAMKGQGK